MSGEDEEYKMDGHHRKRELLPHFHSPITEKPLPESLLLNYHEQKSDSNLRAINQRNLSPDKGQLMLHIIRRAKKKVPANNDLIDVAASINIRGYGGTKEYKE